MLARKRGLALLAAFAALPGCGGGDDDAQPVETATQPAVASDQRGVLQTIDALQSASRRGAGADICGDLFTPRLVRSLERASTRDCATEVRTRLFRRDDVISVQRGIEVEGTSATAVIRKGDGDVSTLHMLKLAGRWRIDRVTPAGPS
jgi:hypothetical protein